MQNTGNAHKQKGRVDCASLDITRVWITRAKQKSLKQKTTTGIL